MAAKKNVLEYVQAALNVMESDQVDSISDTEESVMVAELLRQVYDELIERKEWLFLYQAITLTPAADVTSPTKFTIPDNVRRIEWLSYNISQDGGEYTRRELCYTEPHDFLQKFGNGSLSSMIITIGDSIKFHATLDKMPTHWTSFDDETVYMNSIDASIQSTLTSDRLQGWGYVHPEFQITDTFVPDLPVRMVPLLQHTLNNAASQAYKQQVSGLDQEREQRQMAVMVRDNNRSHRLNVNKVNYGRGR